MSLLRRTSDHVNEKLHRAIDQVDALDYSYQKQLEPLQKVRRNVADVLTSENRLQTEARRILGTT